MRKQKGMLPCHTDHYNAGCDKSDNNLHAMLCYSGRTGLWKNRKSPFVLFGVSCVCVQAFLVIVMGCVIQLHFFYPVLSADWDVGQRVIGVKHGVTAGALDVYTVISRKS